MKHICVIGTGYVGLVNGTCFADLGNSVVTVDIDQAKIDALKAGHMPIYEPGLREIVERNVRAGRLRFTTSYEEGLKDAEFVFICVGTPEGDNGEAELKYVRAAAATVAKTMTRPLVVINKSTVPIGTGDLVSTVIRNSQPVPIKYAVVSCPEFLREGSAVQDFMVPDRTVLGAAPEDSWAAEAVAQLYLPLRAPIMMTDLRTAEMIKYASNAFLATRLSFINEIANICERLGADVIEVARGMGFDRRIGHHFLQPGVGYGGSCFTPDELVYVSQKGRLVARTLEKLFGDAGVAVREGTVEVIRPQELAVLGFDAQTGCPDTVSVHALTRRPYQGQMVTLHTSMGRELTVTADHPILLVADDGYHIVPAARVQPEDVVMALTELPALRDVESLDLIDLLEGTALDDDVMVAPTDDSFSAQYATFARAIPSELLNYPHEIKRHNRMSMPVYRALRRQGLLGDISHASLQLYTAKGAGTRINAVIPVNTELLRLLGYYAAEGFISLESGREGAVRERIGFTFHAEEREYLDDVTAILAGLGVKSSAYNRQNSATIMASSRVLGWLLRDVLEVGTRSEDKRLPSLVFNVHPMLRAEFVRGAFSGDGSFSPVQSGKNGMIEYATVSKTLAHGLSLVLQSLGIVPSLRARMMNKSTMPAYVLRVSGYEQLRQLVNAFGEKRRQTMVDLLDGYERHIKPHGYRPNGTTALLKVTAVEMTEADQMVYSLETSTGVVVLGSGLVQKQCFPKDVKALTYMAEEAGAHPQLLNSVTEINDFQRKRVADKLHQLLGDVSGKTVALWGLAFKENTDDIRESPALDIARHLLRRGAVVRAYDPVAMPNSAEELPELVMCSDPYDAVQGADAVVVATPWNEFKQVDLDRVRGLMARLVMVDGRNIYDPERLKALGFTYRGVGRGYNGDGV